MKNNDIIDTNNENVVYLISDKAVKDEFGEAMASTIATDQVITWAKFVLTDDKPNGNGQRVPSEEFANLIKTGTYKPVKMAIGEIKDGHEDAKPIGVITNLTQVDNKIVALAALWDHERGGDVSAIKERVKSGKPVNVSWEILYSDTVLNDGVTDLIGLTLAAATIVGIPAYAGRTQFLAVAAKKWSPAYIQKLPDTSFLHIGNDGTRYFAYKDDTGKIDPSRFQPITEEIANTPLPQNTLKTIRHQVKKLQTMISADASIQELLAEEGGNYTEEDIVDTKELENEVVDLKVKLASATDAQVVKEKELSDALALAEELKTKVETLEVEIGPLREFKQGADEVATKETKLSGIKAKFESAGLVKDEAYFVENTEKLLAMDEGSLEFMLQEMVAFKSEEKGEGEASLKLPKVPVISGKTDNLSDPKDLADALRARNKK